MNCTDCDDKICRTKQSSCNREVFDKSDIINKYHESSYEEIIRSAALLIDNGRSGTLSRLEEIIEYAKTMHYSKLGLAYCYGMEKTAKAFQTILAGKGFEVSAISCTVGGIKQNEINSSSCINKISCNPLGQANQLNAEKADLTLIIGICLGHDIILQRNLQMDFTTLIVKDRVNNNNPILALNNV